MKCTVELRNRVKRLHGQMQGILTMMESNQPCDQLMIQLKAVRANLDKTLSLLTTENLQQVLHRAPSDEKGVKAALDLIVKSR